MKVKNTAYRLKTKFEFIQDGLWDFKREVPYNWNPHGEMNFSLGAPIAESLSAKCKAKSGFRSKGWYYRPTDYVEAFPNEVTLYRFKTEAEFKAENNWDKKNNRPYGWNSKIMYLLGQDIPFGFNPFCKEETAFLFCDVVFNDSDYTKLSEPKKLIVEDGFISAVKDTFKPKKVDALTGVSVTIAVVFVLFVTIYAICLK